jgi:hypothetical protein|tara:strand:- start:15 stop:725 length:711 start_codon:yes stop_codon:yes gene_type:complete
MKILELFSGTESFSKVARARGHECFTIDVEKHFNPDLCKDILDIEIKDIPFKPDIIWASPPCTTFSTLSNFRYWKDLKPKNSKACVNLAYVMKTLELIDELNPKYFFIENPRALLRKFDFMIKLYRNTITYCQYGLPFMKPTDIWTNCSEWNPKPVCKNGDPCHNPAPRGSQTGIQGKGSQAVTSTNNFGNIDVKASRAIVPEKLCLEIIKCCENNDTSQSELKVETKQSVVEDRN